ADKRAVNREDARKESCGRDVFGVEEVEVGWKPGSQSRESPTERYGVEEHEYPCARIARRHLQRFTTVAIGKYILACSTRDLTSVDVVDALPDQLKVVRVHAHD